MGAAVAAVGSVTTVLGQVSSLFGGGGPNLQENGIIDGWVAQIRSDPSSLASHKTWIGLRCWAGDQTVLGEYRQLFGDNAPTCGVGNLESRGYACQAAQSLTGLMGPMGPCQGAQFNNTRGTTGGTVPVIGVNTAGQVTGTVPASSLTAGVNLYLLLGVLAVVVFLLFRRRG